MIRFALAAGLCLLAVPLPATADDERNLPVESIDGQRLQLRGVSAEQDASGLRASGWVRRDPGNYGPVQAHLHAIALDANGRALQTVETRWHGNLPTVVRSRHAALFRVEFDPAVAASTSIVRVSVEPGPLHTASQP